MEKKNINPNNNGKNNKQKRPRFNLTWFYVIIAVALGWLLFNSEGSGAGGGMSKQGTYSEFRQYVEKGYASRVEVNTSRNQLNMYVKPEHIRDVFRSAESDKSGKEPYVVVKYGSIDKVEELTGYNFLSTLEDKVENVIESKENIKDWPKYYPRR
jgi:cell division protease FtsH